MPRYQILLIIFFLQAVQIFPESEGGANPGAADEPLIISNEAAGAQIAKNLYFYEDQSAALTFQEITKASLAWQKNKKTHPNFGFTASAIWGYFDLKNESSEQQIRYLLFEHPRVEDIRIYQIRPGESESYIESRAGSRLEPEQKEFHYRQQVVSLQFPQNSLSRVYFRVSSSNIIELPLYLYSRAGLMNYVFINNMLLGVYFGIVIAMSLYNLFLFYSMRDSAYLYYVGFALSAGFLQFNSMGFFTYFGLVANTELQNKLIALVGGCGPLAVMFLVKKFYEITSDRKMAYRIWQLILVFVMLATAVALINYRWVKILFGAVIITSFYFVIMAYLNYHRSYYHRLFFYGVFCSILGIVVYSAKAFNIIIPFFTRYGFSIGQSFELIFIVFALAGRMRALDQEKSITELNSQKLELAIKEKEIRRKNLELAGMKKIIQPNFLINSLKKVAHSPPERSDEAVKIVYDIAEEFRYIINRSTQKYADLIEEMRICELHLKIMERVRNKKYSLECRGFPDDYQLPHLLLHTLIEYAISHERSESPGSEICIEYKASGPTEKDNNDSASEYSEIFFRAQGDYDWRKRDESLASMAYIETLLDEIYGSAWSMTTDYTAMSCEVTFKLAAAYESQIEAPKE